MATHIGTIILTVNGIEVDVKELKPDHDLKREAVRAMNSRNRPPGFTEGMPEYNLSVTAAIPKSGDLDWENITNATVTAFDDVGIARFQWRGCFTKRVGRSFVVDGETTQDIDLGALDFRRLG